MLEQINEGIHRTTQRIINAGQKPIEFAIGMGDNSSLGITRMIRQYQGVDPAGLDCSDAYTYGGYASTAIEVLAGGAGIIKALGKGAVKRGLKTCLRCFEADTQVQTDEGLKPVEEIEAGDRVLSYNEQTGFLEYQEVLEKMTRYADDVYSVKVAGESKPLGVTSEHPFFVRVRRARDNISAAESDDGE